MKIIPIILLLHISFYAFAQIEKIKDFNNDGIKDTLRISNDDSQFYPTYIDGETQEVFELRKSEYSKNQFITFFSMPEALMRTENEWYLDTLKGSLLPNVEIRKSIPSLEWILAAFESNHKIEKGYFSQFINAPLKWHCWYAEPPEFYLFKVKTDTLNLPNYFYSEDLPKYGMLFYYGHNHVDDSQPNPWYNSVFKNKDMEILKTKHGLILLKNDSYAWLFHTDAFLTGSPSKLRWESIKKILVHKHYIFLHHGSPVLGENRVFIINTKNGNIGRLKLENDFYENSNNCFKMKIHKNHLILESITNGNCMKGTDKGEILEFELKKLLKSLGKLKKNKSMFKFNTSG